MWVRTDWNPLLLPSSAFVLGAGGGGFAIPVGSEGWGVSKQSQPATDDSSGRAREEATAPVATWESLATADPQGQRFLVGAVHAFSRDLF